MEGVWFPECPFWEIEKWRIKNSLEMNPPKRTARS
jgi:hypothetical protein